MERNKKFVIVCAPEELRRIQQIADERGLSASAFARTTLIREINAEAARA